MMMGNKEEEEETKKKKASRQLLMRMMSRFFVVVLRFWLARCLAWWFVSGLDLEFMCERFWFHRLWVEKFVTGGERDEPRRLLHLYSNYLPEKKNEINDEWTDDGSREKTWWFPFTTLARRSLKSLFAALRMCTIICMEINYGGSLRFSWKLHKFGLRKDRASEEREGSHQAKGRPFSQWH